MWEERDKLREELLSKKDLGLDYLGEYQPIQIAEDPKIWRFIVRKVCFGEKAKTVANLLLLLKRLGLWISSVISAKARNRDWIEMRGDLWRTISSNGVNPYGIHRCPTGFWGGYISRNTPSLGWQYEGRLANFQNSIGRKQADDTTELQTFATFQEKGRMTLMVEL